MHLILGIIFVVSLFIFGSDFDPIYLNQVHIFGPFHIFILVFI